MTRTTPIKLGRGFAVRVAILFLLLCWPLAVFGQPSYFGDTPSYVNSGAKAVAFVEHRLASLLPKHPGATAAPSSDREAGPPSDPKGARSIAYSVAVYALRGPGVSLVYLAMAQTLVLAWTIALCATVAGASSGWRFWAVAGVTAIATPAAIFSNFAMPDIFAGVLIAGMVLLATGLRALSVPTRLLLSAICAFAVLSHASHPPLGLGLLMVSAAALWLRREGWKPWLVNVGWLALPVVAGMAATIAVNFIGFGDASIAAKRFPLALARSLEDGPARWYLDKNCPKLRYAICEVFPNGMPARVPDLLWGPDGLAGKATPEQMDRIRAEEQEIILKSAQAYPSVHAERTLSNIGLQTIRFGLTDASYGWRMRPDPQEVAQLDSYPAPALDWLRTCSEWLTVAAVLASLAGIALYWRRLELSGRLAVLLVFAGLGGNALICAVFSGVAERYQARVIWVLPLFASALVLSAWRNGLRLEPAVRDCVAEGAD